MIIVLKDADFSSDNIGSITLPVELHQFTKNIFSKLTRFSEDSEQAIAVDKFIKALDEQGVLSHLSFLTMPWLAADSTELWYDIISDSMMSGETSYFTIADGEVSCSAYSKSVNTPTSIPTLNFFGLIKDSDSFGGHVYNIFRGTNSFISSGAKFGTQSNPSTGTAVGTEVNYNNNYGYKNASSIYKYALIEIGALTLLDQDSDTFINGVSVGISGSFDNTTAIGNSISKYSPAGKDVSIRSISFAGDGTALTSTQRTAIISAMDTLQEELTELES